jgi:hypothetical protein
MFGKTTAPVVAESAGQDANLHLDEHDGDSCHHGSGMIPLSVLGLDLPAPAEGWSVWLASQGVSVVFDDVGRRCVARSDARALFEQQRLGEIRRQDAAHRQEAAAIAADRAWRATLPRGVSWLDVPPGVLPVVAMTEQAKAEMPRRRSLLEDAFAGQGTTMYVDEPQPMFEDES